MASQSLREIVETLTPDEQAAVREFIEFLKRKSLVESPFQAAVNEFIGEHPELLRRLAQ
ncbi:MAG TPA: hypothetical protein VLY04_17050 [Bryobacteraceae bacterium]|nr:hypothetical protein [Bryobacteraceae bacterium]